MVKTFLTLLVFLAAGSVAHAQLPVGFGIKAGIPFVEAYNVAAGTLSGSTLQAAYSSNATDFVFGPMIEFRLPASVSVEVDALWRDVGFRRVISGAISPTPPTGTVASASVGASAWEFPVLLKYKFKGIALARPYLGAGLAFKHITSDGVVELVHRNSTGVVLEGGVEFKVLLLRIAPEIRYSGYTVASFESPSGLLKTNKNQLSFLVGFTF